MIIDNIQHLLFSLVLIIVLFDSMDFSPRMRANIAAAASSGLIEFTNAHSNEVVKLFTLWFFGVVLVLGTLSIVVGNLFPKSTGASILGTSFLAFFLCLASFSMWQHRRPAMVVQLRNHIVTTAAKKFQVTLYMTILAFVFGLVFISLKSGLDMEPNGIDLESLFTVLLIVGLTIFILLFLIEVVTFAGLQLFVLMPTIVILFSFYGCVTISKLFMRTGWLPLKRCLMAYGCAYTIYHLAWA